MSFARELDISSCGATVQEAASNLDEAVSGFLDAARERGTLREILEEAGFTQEDNTKWHAPNLVSMEKMHLAI